GAGPRPKPIPPPEPPPPAHGDLSLLRGRFERLPAAHRLGELLRARARSLAQRLAQQQFRGDLFADRFERARERLLALLQLDQVKPEIGPHGTADLSRRQRERRVFERLHHLAAREEPEIAPADLGAGVLRDLGRHVLARLSLPDPLGGGLDFAAHASDLLVRGALPQRAQDVARAHALGSVVLLALLLVDLRDLLGATRDRGGDRLGRDLGRVALARVERRERDLDLLEVAPRGLAGLALRALGVALEQREHLNREQGEAAIRHERLLAAVDVLRVLLELLAVELALLVAEPRIRQDH